MRYLWLIMVFAVAFCFAGAAFAAEYYVAPDGSPDNQGTIESPWDIESVFAGRQRIEPGSTVYLKGGTYRHPDRTRAGGAYSFSMKSEKDNPIHIRPVPGERVTIDAGMTVQGAEYVWMWDLEFTITEAHDWDRRVDQAGSHIDRDDMPGGGINITGATECKFINLVVHNTPSTGISFWRNAIDSELHGCLIHENGWIGPDRYHGPGIYTQNDKGEKWITDCILWGNYSTTIQAYGSANAYVNNFRIIGNISFAPLKEGGRARILVGGGRPSEGIIVNENILYEVPLQIGYNAPHNEDCIVHDNLIVNAGMSINRYREVDDENNRRLAANDPRPEEPEYIIRPNKYDENRANLAIFNWRKAESVSVDMGDFLNEGDSFRVMNSLDFFGEPVAEGTYAGEAVDVAIPAIDKTGEGEFCAFVILRQPAE